MLLDRVQMNNVSKWNNVLKCPDITLPNAFKWACSLKSFQHWSFYSRIASNLFQCLHSVSLQNPWLYLVCSSQMKIIFSSKSLLNTSHSDIWTLSTWTYNSLQHLNMCIGCHSKFPSNFILFIRLNSQFAQLANDQILDWLIQCHF